MARQFIYTVNGFCPTQEKMYNLPIIYVDDSPANPEKPRRYLKGTADCGYTKKGGQCPLSECPIHKAADEIRH